MEFRIPQNGEVEDCNEKTLMAAGAVRILRIFMTTYADKKVGIGVTGDTRIITGGQDKTLVHGSLEITANEDESQFMMMSGTESMKSTLMYSK